MSISKLRRRHLNGESKARRRRGNGKAVATAAYALPAMNDLFFGALDARAFCALSAAAAGLVKGSAKVLHYLRALKSEPPSALKAAG